MAIIDVRSITAEQIEAVAICDMDGEICSMALPIGAVEFEQCHEDWTYGGKLIQNAFPMLSAEQREFVKTGITPEKWNEIFGDNDE